MTDARKAPSPLRLRWAERGERARYFVKSDGTVLVREPEEDGDEPYFNDTEKFVRPAIITDPIDVTALIKDLFKMDGNYFLLSDFTEDVLPILRKHGIE